MTKLSPTQAAIGEAARTTLASVSTNPSMELATLAAQVGALEHHVQALLDVVGELTS